jgi:hypothetical protein
MEEPAVPDETATKETAEKEEYGKEENPAIDNMVGVAKEEMPTGKVKEAEKEDVTMDVQEEQAVKENAPTTEPEEKEPDGVDKQEKQGTKEWTDMVDGIALFSDLLYQQELPQHAAFEDDGLLSKKSPANISGCGHLLRLDVVVEAMGEEEAQPILAKVNDLVWFLHQHQSTLFVQSCR